MQEIWQQALLPYNLPLTIMLGFVGLYVFLLILGAVDFDFLDFDFDTDGLDSDLDAGGASDAGLFASVLKLVNGSDIPLMLLLSLFTIFMWGANLCLNYYFNPDGTWLVAGILALVAFFISVIIMRLVSKPLSPFLRSFRAGENNDEPVVGRVAKVKSSQLTEKYGQLLVPRMKGAPALVNAKLEDGAQVANKDEFVLVTGKSEGLFIARLASELERDDSKVAYGDDWG